MPNDQPRTQQLAIGLAVIALFLMIVVGGIATYLWHGRAEVEEQSGQASSANPEKPAIDLTPVPIKKVPPAREGFVGSESCAKCHAELFASYRQHPMAQSLFAIQDAPMIEDYEHGEFTAPGSMHYQVDKQGERVLHRELMLDGQQKPIYQLEKEIHFVLGSGRRGRSYLIYDGGHIYQSAISWFSQAGKWDLSPIHAGQIHPRFSRRLGEGCFYCHAGRTALYPELEDTYPAQPFLEAAIGCERCHGPGEAHIAFREASQPAAGPDPIVNPAALDKPEAEAICAQCHLAGESIVQRSGRRHRDFRPGEALENTWLIFVAQPGDNQNALRRAVSHVEQMHASRCYQASGTMNCVTCHDPHSSPAPEQREMFYNTRCGNCHGPNQTSCALPESERLAAPQMGSCIGCHMPRFPTYDIPHTAGSDHRILRRPLGDEPSASPANAMMTPRLFNNAEKRLPKHEVERGIGLALIEQPVVRNDRQLMATALTLVVSTDDESAIRDPNLMIEAVGDDLVALRQLGGIFQSQDDFERANVCWHRIIQLLPPDEEARYWLTKNCQQQGEFDQALEHLRYVLAQSPDDPGVQYLKGQLLDQVGDLQGGIQAAEQALQLDPALTPIRQWLLDAYRRAGQPDKRQQQLEMLRRMNEAKRSPAK